MAKGNPKPKKTKSVSRGKFSVGVDNNAWETKGKKTVKTKRSGEVVSKTKLRGTGYANPIKKINDKTVSSGGVTRSSSKKTTFANPKAIKRRITRHK